METMTKEAGGDLGRKVLILLKKEKVPLTPKQITQKLRACRRADGLPACKHDVASVIDSLTPYELLAEDDEGGIYLLDRDEM